MGNRGEERSVEDKTSEQDVNEKRVQGRWQFWRLQLLKDNKEKHTTTLAWPTKAKTLMAINAKEQ